MPAHNENGAALAERISMSIGAAIGPSDWFLVDQVRVDAFGSAIDAHDAIHTDPAEAARSSFGGTIAQGFYIAGLMPKLLRQTFRPEGLGPGMAYGVEKLRFPAVVRCGRQVRLSGRLEKVEAVGPAAMAWFDLAVEIEGETKPACVGTLLMRYTGVRSDG